MNKIAALWNQFWFKPGSELNFKLVRFFIFTGGAVFGFFVVDSHPATFYDHWQPISFYHLLDGPLNHETLKILRWLWLAFGFIAGFGLFYPVTALLTFICGAIFLGHDYNFGVVYHSHHMYIMGVTILTFSEWFQLLTGKNKDRAEYYNWSIQWVKCYVVWVFFLCGIEKLYAGGGLNWAFSESFYMRLWTNPYHPPLTQWALEQPLFVSQIFAGIALLVVELFAPLAFWGRRMGVVYFFIWSFFHLAVTLTYGNHLTFYSHIFCYTAFIDWEYYFNKYSQKRGSNVSK
jgi:hypothetical protein